MDEDLKVTLVTEEMVTRAWAAFLDGVTAVTPKHGDHPRAVMRRALEAVLHTPDIDGAVAELHRDADGNVVASIRIPAPHPE